MKPRLMLLRFPSITAYLPAGGNLARVPHASSSQEGHSLFTEQFEKLLRQITNTSSRPAVPAIASAPAATPRGLPPHVPQALPFREVNNLTHVLCSRCELLFTTRAFA